MTFFAAVLSSSSNGSTLNNVEPGLLGFLVVAGIGIALVFLLLSMNKQFRKLPPPPEETTGETEGAETTTTSTGTTTSGDANRG